MVTRIPFAPDFKAFADAGKQLADLHLNYEQLKPWPLNFIEAEGVPLSYVVADKMKTIRARREARAISEAPSLRFGLGLLLRAGMGFSSFTASRKTLAPGSSPN